MARQEHDREDLFAEAQALVPRAELQVPGNPLPVVVGFRGDCGSAYFGPQAVYHFSADGRLRRAYLSGELYKAEAGRLVALRRRRRPEAVLLDRRELDPVQTADVLKALQQRLKHLHQAVLQGAVRVSRQVPTEEDVLRRIAAWLNQWSDSPPQVARSAGLR